MMLEGKTVLVTGGTGFIGSRLVEKLVIEQRARVRMIVRNFTKAVRASRLPVEMIAGDINDRNLVQRAASGCESVFHCAYDFAGSRNEQLRTGKTGTENVCEAVLSERVGRLVHVSTFVVYSPMSSGTLTEESTWGKAPNSYVRVKREAEKLVLAQHRERGLPVVVVQPTLVYGPHSPHWTLGLARQLKTGLVPLIDGGNGFCNAVYVDDVADSLILAATRPNVDGQVFLISAEEPVTWKAFYAALEAALEVQGTVNMPLERIHEEIAKSRKQPNVLARMLQAARHPEVYPQLISLPVARHLLQALRRGLSDEQWNALKANLLRTDEAPAFTPDRVETKPLCLPDDSLLALYLTKTHVSISKARERLGYEPKFDLERGMGLTARFLQWANVA
jgi:nucleoside-diphosphate-sugar epimerase